MSASPAKSFVRADGSPRRVLYAEDQFTSRIVTTAMLERMGFVVDAVEDGELALQRAHKAEYDVILLDIEMPVMDGVTAARSIRREVSHAEATPILALSAFLADSTEKTKWRDAFDEALPKPANGNELMRAMKSAVAVRDRNVARLPAVPSNKELGAALRESLGPEAWRGLSVTAAVEMGHIVNVMAAAQQAGDTEATIKAARRLLGLAQSFGAVKIADAAAKLIEGKTKVEALPTLIQRFSLKMTRN